LIISKVDSAAFHIFLLKVSFLIKCFASAFAKGIRSYFMLVLHLKQ